MKFRKTSQLAVALALLLGAAYDKVDAKEIVGYYPSWQWYDRAHLVRPATIPYGKLTVINFAFFKPNPNGTLEGTDAWADEQILRGEKDWSTGGFKAGTSLIDLAHKNGVKVMVSIGGWTLSDEFPAIAASPALREAFANSCVKAITDYGFDGIDIDWEYPGYADHKGTPADKGNFTLLLQAVRAKLDAHGATTARKYLLSAAMPAGPVRVAEIEMQKVAQLLDFMNVMTYDFFGAWDKTTGHNSPLFLGDGAADPTFNLDAAFRLYHVTHGIPSDKINVGVAFYGRTFKGATALNGPHTGADTPNFTADDGTPMYYNIVKAMATGGYQRFWDAKAKVPYLLNPATQSMVSYDDAESVALKAKYAVDNRARGVIVWEITGDVLDDGRTPLLDQLNSSLGIPPRPTVGTQPMRSAVLSGQPNLVSAGVSGGLLRLAWDREGVIPSRITLSDIGGRAIRSWDNPPVAGKGAALALGEAPGVTGMYLVRMEFAGGGRAFGKVSIASPD